MKKLAPASESDIAFFRSPAEFGRWLRQHHATEPELWVGFHKRKTGKPSLTWPESVDEALCYGWIDGLRRRVDACRYTIRFTPRKLRSTWSTVNIGRIQALTEEGRMRAAGLNAYAGRDEKRSGIYSYEQRPAGLDAIYEKRLRANRKAWAYFQTQPAWYRRTMAHWVMSAKKEETRFKRLAALIEDSAHGRTIQPLTRPARPT